MKNLYYHKWIACIILSCLPGLRAGAQTEKGKDLPVRFQEFQLLAHQEKIYAHTDKTFYLAGEVIWFKIYVVDGFFHRPARNSGLSYVELIGKDQKPLLQTVIDLDKGKGSGSLTLPSWIPSGNYILRAYTAWMKNFSPQGYFMQQLTVVNTINEPVVFSPAPPDSAADIQFFPEGGNLVYGLSSKVAVKATGSNGKGINCRGIILDQQADSITSFETKLFGMSYFIFTPEKGKTYHAVIYAPDIPSHSPAAAPFPHNSRPSENSRSLPLPASYEQGYVLTLSDSGKDKIRITIHSHSPGANPAVYLFAQTHNLVKSFQVGYLSNDEVNFYIAKKDLGEGVSRITAFNSDRAPVCERLYFKRPERRLLIEGNISPSGYNPRQKINMILSSRVSSPEDPSGLPANADLSLSVFRTDSLQAIPEDNILNYLLLSSELKGKIESPGYYFDSRDNTAAAAADNLMLTQGWTRFRWEEVLQNKKPYFEFLPEPNGPVVNGKITDRATGNPAPVTIAYLSIPGKDFECSSAQSLPDGNIRWNIKKRFGPHEMIVQPGSLPDSNYRIDIANPFSDKFSSFRIPDLHLDPALKSELLYRSVNMQVENTYRIEARRRFRYQPSYDTMTMPFYGRPDKAYYLDDYTRFETMEEVMNEYVGDVHLRRQSGSSYFRVRNDLFNTFFEDSPLLLLDGMPVMDAGRILSLDPLKVKKIEVVSRKFYTGPLVNDGIVSFTTYEGNLGGYSLDPGALVVQYNGLQQQREFYSPVYDTKEQKESPIPDFRNQLLWSPDIKMAGDGKKEISFYTSDFSGQFVIIVQGLTEEGLPGSAVFHFNVVPSTSGFPAASTRQAPRLQSSAGQLLP